MKHEYHIQLKEGCEPYAALSPRRVPIPLVQKVNEELKRVKRESTIEEVEGPTDWFADIVSVLKSNNTVRICVDLTKLNKGVYDKNAMLCQVLNSH